MMTRNVPLIGVALLFYSSVLGAEVAGGYSPQPYGDPIRSNAENAVDLMKFNNWLNIKYSSAPSERRQGFKEHMYLILDSHVKQLYQREKKILPQESDPILHSCFTWASRMGVYGARTILEDLKPEEAVKVSGTLPPKSFVLSFGGDLLTLSSSLGHWRVKFPYHFMIGILNDFTATNGQRTQLASISTGFGRHTHDDGYSQATIMILYTPEPAAGFDSYWLKLMRLSASDRVGDTESQLPTYQGYDVESHLHSDLVFRETARGAMAVAYMGLDGAYEWNRPHFEDFLKNLQVLRK
jgi:hypothetical protein